MNKRLGWLIAALLLAGLQTTAGRQATAQGEKLLAAAQHKATIDGDLKGAIEEYRKIVAGAATNRELAAQALVQMAECYQKLGDVESSRIYERVLREYADQPEAVSVARARLARARPAAGDAGIVTRQVWTGPKVDLFGTVSLDGRFLSFVDWSTGNVALHDLTTGTDRPLTDKRTFMDSPAEFGQETAISPDGKQVAYAWHAKGGRWELRVIGTEGPVAAAPRRIQTEENIQAAAPYAWSPDGRWIAVQCRKNDRTADIALANVADGSLRRLKTVDWRASTRLSFSPDGRFLAFDLPSSEKTAARDVFVLPVDGSREIPVSVHPANDVAVGWTPDGRHLLFASDRSGAKGLWSIAWTEGKPQREPELIKTDIDMDAPLGITRAGALYYGIRLSQSDVFVATMDAESGEVLSPPTRPIEQFVGTNHSPDWSPDGKALAYVSRRKVLAVRSMETGETRELRPGFDWIFLPRWAPDGRSLAVIADDRGLRGLHRIDALTGAASLIVQIPSGHTPWGLDWTPDGRKIVYRDMHARGAVVIEHDVESGAEREIVHGGATSASLSPDGRLVAFAGKSGTAWPLMVAPVDGGEPREVRVQGVQTPIMVLSWTPDSRFILFQAISPMDESRGLWLVSPEGGQARKVGLKLDTTVAPLRFNPRTNQIAVTAKMSKQEVWVLEHFLPAAKAPTTGRKN